MSKARQQQFGGQQSSQLPNELGGMSSSRIISSCRSTLYDTETGERIDAPPIEYPVSNVIESRNTDRELYNQALESAQNKYSALNNIRIVPEGETTSTQKTLNSILDASATRPYIVLQPPSKASDTYTPVSNCYVVNLMYLNGVTAAIESRITNNVTITGGSITNVTITNSTIGLTSIPIHDNILHIPITADQVNTPASPTTTNVGNTTGNTGKGQTFQPGLANQITHCEFDLINVGTPTDGVYVELYATSGGLPTGSALARSAIVQARDIGGTRTTIGFFFPYNSTTSGTGTWLLPATTYAIVLFRTGSVDASNYYNTYDKTGDLYPNGQIVKWDGASWSAGTSGFDLFFTTYYGNSTPTGFILDQLQIGNGILPIQNLGTGTLTSGAVLTVPASGNSAVWTTTPAFGAITVTTVNNVTITQPGTPATLTIAADGSLVTVGAFTVTLTATGTTNLTLPTSGTLATTSDLSSYVPYTGASGTVNLGTNILAVGNLWIGGGGSPQYYAVIDFLGTTVNRIINFPDAAGTVVLTTGANADVDLGAYDISCVTAKIQSSAYPTKYAAITWVGSMNDNATITLPNQITTTLLCTQDIGGTVQAYNANLASLAGLTYVSTSFVKMTAANTFSLDTTAYAPLASPTFTGTVTIPTPFTIGAVSMTATGTQLNYLASATGTTGTTSTNLVFSTSPTLVTPLLGTPTSGVLTNCTGYVGDSSLTTIGTLTSDVLISKVTPMFKGTHTTDTAYYSLYRSGAANTASTILDSQVYKAGAAGSGVNFAKTNDYITCGAGPSIVGDLTISGWIKLDVGLTSQSTEFGIMNKGDTTWNKSNYGFYGYTASGGGIAFFGGRADSVANAFYCAKSGYTGLNDLAWHMFHCVWDRDVGPKVYIDAVDISMTISTNVNTDLRTSGHTLILGNASWALATYAMDGNLDEVVIWDKAMSAAEITTDYASGSGVYHTSGTNKQSIHHLDENTGTDAADSSGNGWNGTLTNGPTWTTGKVLAPGTLVLRSMLQLLDDTTVGIPGTLYVGDKTNNDHYTVIQGVRTSFYGGTPVALGAALTTQLTTITHTAPGTPDYAIQNLVQNTGFGFVTADEGNSVLKVIANLQTRCAELEARLGSATGVKLFT